MAKGYPDFEGNKSALYLMAEWAAKEGTDKNFIVSDDHVASGGIFFGTYTPGSGKTLYICGFSFYIAAEDAADKDQFQMGYAYIANNTDGIFLAWLGGNGGGSVAFAKPLVLAEGKQLGYVWGNQSNHECHGALTVWGYEI